MRLVSLLALLEACALAQKCYYPNGSEAKDGVSCGSNSDICCSNDHACLDNGLCYNPTVDEFGRYSCTDREWGETCPQICSDRPQSLYGNEAVIQCEDGSWCCNTNRPERAGNLSCCQGHIDGEPFDFADGKIFATLRGGKATPTTGKFDVTPSPTTVSDSMSSSDPTMIAGVPAPPSSRTSRASSTHLSSKAPSSSLSSGTSIVNSTPTSTDSDAVTAMPGPMEDNSSQSNGKTVGIAVAVPLAIIAAALIAWLVWRRRRPIRAETPPPLPYISRSPPTHFDEKLASTGIDPAQYNDHARNSVIPSEIDSNEVRIPIAPADTAHMATLGISASDYAREQTSTTLYANARPNYTAYNPSVVSSNNGVGNGVSPPMPNMPHSPTTSTVVSAPNGGDYSEWAVTPHLPQQRWSGTTAQGSGAEGTGYGAGVGHQRNASAASAGSGRRYSEAQEIMGRPVRPPSTIAELP